MSSQNNFIAGSYTATLVAGSSGATSIGRTRNGFRIQERLLSQPVLVDDFGDAPVDSVNQGTEYTVTLDSVEYVLIVNAMAAPEGTQGNANAKVGILNSTLAGQLVLTPIAGTSAAGLIGQATYTFPLAIIQGEMVRLLSSKLREGPLTFHVYPNLSTGEVYQTS